jgi:hypothetical protein
VDHERSNFADFESYRALHAEVAGRITRNDASWGAMCEAIASGVGRLVLSYLEGRLVGGTLIFGFHEHGVLRQRSLSTRTVRQTAFPLSDLRGDA